MLNEQEIEKIVAGQVDWLDFRDTLMKPTMEFTDSGYSFMKTIREWAEGRDVHLVEVNDNHACGSLLLMIPTGLGKLYAGAMCILVCQHGAEPVQFSLGPSALMAIRDVCDEILETRKG